MAQRAVHISYRRSGGLAGIDMTAEAAADELAADNAAVAHQLLAGGAAGSGAQEGTRAGSGHGGGAGADQFTYDLKVDDGQQTRSYRWTETQVPDTVRQLLTAMHSKAKPAPPA